MPHDIRVTAVENMENVTPSLPKPSSGEREDPRVVNPVAQGRTQSAENGIGQCQFNAVYFKTSLSGTLQRTLHQLRIPLHAPMQALRRGVYQRDPQP